MRLNADWSDLAFRGLFCLIFVGLGGEHIVDDALIQKLMPAWVPYKRLVSLACGLWLFGWGTLVLLGWQLRAGWPFGGPAVRACWRWWLARPVLEFCGGDGRRLGFLGC